MIFNYARFANVSVLNIVCILHDNHGNNGMELYLYFLIALIWFDLIRIRFSICFFIYYHLIFIIILYYYCYCLQRLAAPAVFGSTLALYSLQDVHAKEATVDMNKVRDAIMKVVEDDAEKRDDGTSM